MLNCPMFIIGAFSGGYVNFARDVDFPKCPDCAIAMDVPFLQMEVVPEIFNFEWGECGCAHITLCPNCKRPGLGWSCLVIDIC